MAVTKCMIKTVQCAYLFDPLWNHKRIFKFFCFTNLDIQWDRYEYEFKWKSMFKNICIYNILAIHIFKKICIIYTIYISINKSLKTILNHTAKISHYTSIIAIHYCTKSIQIGTSILFNIHRIRFKQLV